MTGFLTILPLAFVMIAGPQIISAVFLATSHGWRRNSAMYILGALIAVAGLVTIAYFIAKGVKSSGGRSNKGSNGQVIDVVILVLLLVAMVYVFRGRNKPDPPKWMGKLETATPSFSFKLGLLLLSVFPTDLITSITVGSHLAREDNPWVDALPFIGLTLLFLAIPVLAVLILGKRAEALLPKVRDWMNTNSWIVSEIVIVFFIAIEINSLASG